MPILDPRATTLVLIDLQERLMPAIEGGDDAVRNARRLADAARLLEVPVIVTEQYPKGLGRTVPELAPQENALAKTCFAAHDAAGFADRLAASHAVVLAGVEAHVCVLQTALGLRALGRHVYVVRDAIASRRAASVEAAVRRMEQQAVEIITTEMAIFEWIGDAAHPRFKEATALIK